MIPIARFPARIPSPPMRSLPTVIALLLAIALRAQDDPRVFSPYTPTPGAPAPVAGTPQVATTTADSGHVTIHESARITALMKDYASTKQPLHGFRVQIFLGDRTKAEDIRRTFLLRHPDLPAYLSYLAPNFRVRVGDLRTKLDALKMRDELTPEFPGLYVVPDEIEMPRLSAPPAPKR